MPKKQLGAEQIVTKLRQIEVLQGQGKSLAVACKEVGTTEQSLTSPGTKYRSGQSRTLSPPTI